MRRLLPLSFVLFAAALSGFDGGSCGGSAGTEPLDPNNPPNHNNPPPPPPPPTCDGLDEAQCLMTGGCTPSYIDGGTACACPACAPGETCMPCDCPPPTTSHTYDRCNAVDPCAGLTEDQCLNTAGCLPEYGAGDRKACPAIACNPADPNCTNPCQPTMDGYSGCHTGHQCGAVCEIFCPFGNVTDPSGCPICQCNPSPNACAGLDEMACSADPNCQPVYASRPGCLVPPSDGGTGGGGAPCAPDAPSSYSGCEPRNPPSACAAHDENACLADPTCIAEYQGQCTTDRFCDPSDPACGAPVPCDKRYVGCRDASPICPPVACDIYCPYGNAKDPNGCDACACNPGPTDPCATLDEMSCSANPGCTANYADACTKPAPCSMNDPSCGGIAPPPPNCSTVYVGCSSVDPCASLNEMQCVSDPRCAPDYVTPDCAPSDGGPAGGGSGSGSGSRPCLPDAGSCGAPPPPPDCGTPTFGGCHLAAKPCASDADCPGGYCASYASCDAIGCPPAPPPSCVYPAGGAPNH